MTASARPALNERYNLLIVLAALGVFFAADDQTFVVAVLPKMIKGAGLPLDEFYRAAWIVNGYILGYVVAMPLMGRISDAHGHGRVFALALALFMAGSAWVAMSSTLTMMTIARSVQAVGGGAVVPVSMAIVADTMPKHQRAMGLGLMAAASEAGGLIGPLWGGGLSEVIGWRGLFWINIPMCLPVAYGVWRLAGARSTRPGQRIDWTGALLLAASLVCLTIALTDDPIQPRAWAITLSLYLGSIIAFVLFLARQARAPEPLVRLEIFRRRPLSAGFAANLLVGGTLIVAMITVPVFTNIVLQESALVGGLNLMRMTIALPFGAAAGGLLASRLGFSATAAAGMLLAAVGFLGLSFWGGDPGQLLMTAPLLVAGFGFGLVIAPIGTAVVNEVGEGQRATVSSLLTVVRLLGMLVGAALLTTQGLGGFYAEAGQIPFDDPRFSEVLTQVQVDSFHDTFLVTAGVSLAAILPALWLGGRVARRLRAEEVWPFA